MRRLTILLPLLLLSACSDESTPTALPDIAGNADPAAYSGPPPATADVNAFRTYLWSNLVADNRCGACHGERGQAPRFVRADDINLAYDAAGPLVNLSNPAASRLVERVANGHNCWSDDDGVCAEVMTGYIRNWADATLGSSPGDVELVAPPVRIPGSSRTFPGSSGLFAGTVYPVLRDYCSGCHDPGAVSPQAPYFAATNVDTAWNAARSAISLDDAARSRFVQRLRNESHNCWTDCGTAATTMQDAIQDLIDGIPLQPVDPSLLASRALRLADGIPAATGGRHDLNAVARYEFKEGDGNIAHDTSGVTPALDLELLGDVEWVGGWGIRLNGGRAQGSTAASSKLHRLITASGEYTVEAWIAPANVTQEGPARIVSYSGGDEARNFMLGQSMYNYDFLNRAGASDANGEPALSTADADERAQATLQHLVVTYHVATGRSIFLNGRRLPDTDPLAPGSLAAWNNSFALVVGAEVSGMQDWRGVMRLLVVHNRALTARQVRQNYRAGVGERFFLLFGVSHLIDAPQAYVLLEASQYDDDAYLFAAPRFVSLDDAYVPRNIPLAGMRIGINSREALLGQAWQPLEAELDAADYVAGSGQPLSRLGTVVPLESGPDFDEFFLTFEQIGDLTNIVAEVTPPAPPEPLGPVTPDIGVRTFDEINATLAAITGMPATHDDIAATFALVRSQLPAAEHPGSFSSAQQIGITQLAIEYCNALVDDPVARSAFWLGIDFNAGYAGAYDEADERNFLINPLLIATMNTALASQPSLATTRNELAGLVDRLVDSCTGACAAEPVQRTRTIAKAVCAAATANATMLIH